MEHEGYILIADITGYTVFLNESELDHAKGTLADLLELLIDHTNPPLVVSGLEGDAVFSYGLREGFVNSQTFLESIEDTYVAFRRAVELMILNNTCRCNACANVSSLDLKFFIHYGAFALQDVGDHQELMGSNVNLIHRLLKNSVTAETGIRAYILCTDAAEQALGVAGDPETLIAHTEVVPDFGEVKVWIRDMHTVFEARRNQERIEFSPDEIIGTDEIVVAVPSEMLWDYIGQSDFRNLMFGDDRFELENQQTGMVGPGSVYQCYHGKQVISQVVTEWHPLERMVLRQIIPMPGKRPVHLDLDIRLEPVPEGTRLTIIPARVSGPALKGLAVRFMLKMTAKRFREDLVAFRDQVEADFATREVGHEMRAALTPELIGEAAASSLRA